MVKKLKVVDVEEVKPAEELIENKLFNFRCDILLIAYFNLVVIEVKIQ